MKMNRSEKRDSSFSDGRSHWGLRLGISHAVIVIGLITGGLLASFFLGFRVGKKEQFDTYASVSLERFPRLPIADGGDVKQVSERMVDEVYDELQDLSTINQEDMLPHNKDSESSLDLKPVKIVPLQKVINEKTTADMAKNSSADSSTTALVSDKKVKGELTPAQKQQLVSAAGLLRRDKARSQTLGTLVDGEDQALDKVITADTRRDPTSGDQITNAGVKLQPPVEQKVVASLPKSSAAVVRESGIKPLSKGWYVQLAAFETEADANQLQSLLIQNGFRDAHIQEARVKERRYFRVLVGPEDKPILAERLKQQLERESYLSRDPYRGFKPYLKKIG